MHLFLLIPVISFIHSFVIYSFHIYLLNTYEGANTLFGTRVVMGTDGPNSSTLHMLSPTLSQHHPYKPIYLFAPNCISMFMGLGKTVPDSASTACWVINVHVDVVTLFSGLHDSLNYFSKLR